jgi:hypothetical protein
MIMIRALDVAACDEAYHEMQARRERWSTASNLELRRWARAAID